MQGSNTDLAIVLEEVTDAFFILDGEWRFTYLNSEAKRVLACDGKELIGRHLRENLPDTLGPPLHRGLLKAAEEQTTVEFRQHHPMLDAWFEVRAYPLNSGLAVSFRQTNRRGPREDSVRRERWQDLMRRALDASSAGALVTDATLPENPIIYANSALRRITGYTEEEMLGCNCRMFQSGDRDQPELDELREAVRRGEDWMGVLRNYRKDGTLFYNELYVSAVRDGDENITHYIGIQNDVTARLEADRERRESERRLRSVLIRYGSEMITILEPDGTPRYESPAIRGALGYSHIDQLEETSSTLYDHLHPDDVQKMADAVGEALATPGTHPPVEYRIQRADGSWRHFESVGNNLADEPEVEGIVVTTRDITRRKEAEEALGRERNLLRTVMDSTHDAIFAKDTEHRFRLSNRAHQRILGAQSERDVLGKTNADYWGEERAAPFHTDDRQVLDSGESLVDREEEIRTASGEEMWLSTTKVPLRASDGTIEGLVAVSRDVTGRRREQEALIESERLLRAVTRGVPIILIAIDIEGMITLLEGKGLERVGRSPGEEVGNPVLEAYAHLPEIMDNLLQALSGQEIAATVEAAGLAFESRYSPMRNSNGEITGAIGVATDITTKRELEKEMEHRAFHDPLTDLPNRDLFMQRLENALVRASQREKQVAVLFLDLDDFKYVNDSMGHSAGDRLLIEAGKRIRDCLRDEDIVARFGGDEFAVLLEEIPSPGSPALVAQRIAEELHHPFSITGKAGESVTDREIVSTTSIGIALSGPEDTPADAEKLLQQADSALYRAKETGKDHYELFRQEIKDRSVEVLRIGRELHLALERDQFTVYYQPTTSLETDRTIGLEALVRWEHPERGLVSPDEFIPLAEENDLIVSLGRWVLYEACRQAAEWQSLYPARSGETPFKMNVNLSARQLQSPDLFGDVAGALSESGLSPSSLVLEITESVLIGHDHHETSTLYRLKGLGVNLAIDDFGSGYSSLSYLKDLPVDILKVDRSLISDIGQDAAKAAIVSAAIEVAHALGLPAVAEGVERLDELEELRRLGCDVGQGYYWSKPLPADEVTSLL